VAYAIGVAEPMNITVYTEGTGVIPTSRSPSWCASTSTCAQGHHPDARPAAPDLQKTAAYGHFGREEPEFTWEKTDKAPRCAQRRG
jgi:S-adenosylmethionine synthetase